MLVALVSAGVLRHPGRGLYIVGSMSETDVRPRHRQLVRGAFLLYPDAVLTSTSTLLAHDLPVWAPTPVVRRCCVRSIAAAG